MKPPDFRSLLIIRRDNIGDLVCTTPLISALRARFPKAWIAALVNDYARPVLDRHPDLDALYSYQKAKHRQPGQSLWGLYARRLNLLLDLRRRRLDCVVLASPGYQASAERLARWIKPRHVLGFDHGSGVADLPVDKDSPGPLHQVESCFRLLRALNIEGPPPPMKLVYDADKAAALRARLPRGSGPVVAVHISAREANRRWPEAQFAALIDGLMEKHHASVVLTWAPGRSGKREFPGDDDAAERLRSMFSAAPLLAQATPALADLIASLAICDYLICSDGGPVHLSAALGKPVVCLFGSARPEVWHPWGIPYRLLQPPSGQVSDIAVEKVLTAFAELRAAVEA